MSSPMNVTSYWSRPGLKATTQAQGKVGRRKGRVRISITIPTLVIISYSKARIRCRGYHGTTTTPKTATRPVSHCRRAPTHTRFLTSHDVRCLSPSVGCLQGRRKLPAILGCQSSVHTRAMRRIITGILPHNKSAQKYPVREVA